MKCRVPYSAFLAIIISLSLAGNALAYEGISPAPTLRKYIQLPDRDPYLASAIDGLPNYSYAQSGFAVANASHITESRSQPSRIVTINTIDKTISTAATAKNPLQLPIAAEKNRSILTMEGEASYYSRAGCLGCSPNLTMANGQPLNDNALTMAIGADKKHLVGRQARITNLATGESVVVTITDTGGFYQAKYGHRIADLTIASKQAIGMNGGVGQVRVEVF